MNKIVEIGSNSFSRNHFIDLLLEKGDTEVIGIGRSLEKGALFLLYKKPRDFTRLTQEIRIIRE